MDKSCQSSSDSSTITSNSSGANANPTSTRDQYLKHLNKLFSHKISKPAAVASLKKPHFDSNHLVQTQNQPAPIPVPAQPQVLVQSQSNLPPQQHQPPVYNINKNDFNWHFCEKKKKKESTGAISCGSICGKNELNC
ncbi:hypothetical protein SLA2020_000120 [Shorea laevis]